VQAVKVTELRLQKQQELFSDSFSVQLHKYDYDTLRYDNAFEFVTDKNFKNFSVNKELSKGNLYLRSDLRSRTTKIYATRTVTKSLPVFSKILQDCRQ
jgi:hypothetical protein